MKIDIYSHIITKKYLETLDRYGCDVGGLRKLTSLWDMEVRLRIMERFEDLRQVLVPGWTERVKIAPSKEAELVKIANDEIAEIFVKYPDYFIGAAALLPLGDIDYTLKEVDRAVKDLKFTGVYLPTPADGKPIDRPEFTLLYEKMCDYNLPIWLHPARPPQPEYSGEEKSAYGMWLLWGWPYESTLAMTRLVLSKVLQKFPTLKIVIHHAGAMVPFFSERIASFFDSWRTTGKANYKKGLDKKPLDYFRLFYVDTAINGNTPALMAAHSFYGAEHMLFGTDMPYGAGNSAERIRHTIKAIEGMSIPDSDKLKIFEGNAKKLLGVQANWAP